MDGDENELTDTCESATPVVRQRKICDESALTCGTNDY